MRAAHDPFPYDSRASFQRGCVSLEKVVLHALRDSLSQFERRIKPDTELHALKKITERSIFTLEMVLPSVSHMPQPGSSRRRPKLRFDPAVVSVDCSAKYVFFGPS